MSAKPILVGWDSSDGARAALNWALDEARRQHRPIRIALVISSPEPTLGLVPGAVLPPFSDEELDKIIAPAREQAAERAPQVPCDTVVAAGHPVQALIEAAQGCEMVVVGSRGHGAFLSHLIGSISTAVASHCPVPVVVVRGTVTDDENAPVVVGADGSETSAAAVGFAARYADKLGVPLIAVCAAPDPTQMIAPELVITPEYQDELRDEAERFLHESLAGVRSQYPNLDVTMEVSELPAQAALTRAGEGARLVVVGSHGRGGFAGMLLGSVSRAVLFHAPCPIAVVRG